MRHCCPRLHHLVSMFAAKFSQMVERGGKAGEALAHRAQFGIEPVQGAFG